MRKNAIVYTRVSTDEQNNGYSPADQKEKLLKFCENNNIDVVGFYHDDESGKSFDRPQWIKIMAYLKRNNGKVDYIYFLKWDRFSRNVADAYITIRTLKKLGVEPRAIEQPLDFEIPESKIMLSIYLAAPEVDNDRRALNILAGMRRAKKDGRWLGNCPIGYKNTRDDNNKPVIVPEGGEKEKLILEAFTQFSTGLYNMEELRKILYKKGLMVSRNTFPAILANKVYIAKIFVPAFKDEVAVWVDGKHLPIIDNELFYKVQTLLTNKRKKGPAKISTLRAEFPLRGFLSCPQCNRSLTGSASKGRSGKRFFYYHCLSGCKERQKVDEVNNAFVDLLKTLKANPQTMRLYAEVLKDKLQNNNKETKANREQTNKDIEKQTQRLKNAKLLMLDGEVSVVEYREMKVEIEQKIETLTHCLLESEKGLTQSAPKINTCLELLLNLDKYYVNSEVAVKQKIIGSIFPERLTFENKIYRTAKINSVVALICRNGKASRGSKKKKRIVFDALPSEVGTTGFEPVTLCL